MSNLPFPPIEVKFNYHTNYYIVVDTGLLAVAGNKIKELFPNSRLAVITDENVQKAHGDALYESLAKAKLSYKTKVIKAGEKSKSWSVLEEVVEWILANSFERNDVIVAFGGGVVGDLAGFAAAVARRGMPFVQIPTSLMAQADSAIGGKTGINGSKGKNLVGSFHHPALVLSDPALLQTLPPRELRAGYAEVIKYGLIGSPKLFAELEQSWQQVLSNTAQLQQAVYLACGVKADIVRQDEQERGNRALLNLGHTFGHALESAVNYDSGKLVHGEAVAIGLVLAHQFSTKLKFCPEQDSERVTQHLQAVGLPTCLADIKATNFALEQLMSAIKQDKKVKHGKLTFILSKGIGKAFIAHDIKEEQVREFLTECLAKATK